MKINKKHSEVNKILFDDVLKDGQDKENNVQAMTKKKTVYIIAQSLYLNRDKNL